MKAYSIFVCGVRRATIAAKNRKEAVIFYREQSNDYREKSGKGTEWIKAFIAKQ